MNEEPASDLPSTISLDQALRAAFYMTDNYLALEAQPKDALVTYRQYLWSDPARWDDWNAAVRRALADGGDASPVQ